MYYIVNLKLNIFLIIYQRRGDSVQPGAVGALRAGGVRRGEHRGRPTPALLIHHHPTHQVEKAIDRQIES